MRLAIVTLFRNANCVLISVPGSFEEYQQKVAGTNIDPRSLLSTDYFNTFNSAVMIFDMLPDAPDLLDEVDQWQFYNYVDHFKNSGLDFAPLAIEAYEFVPPDIKMKFERKIEGMRVFVEEAAHTLRRLYGAGDMQIFNDFARQATELFRGMMEEGSSLVHGADSSMNQDSIDALF